MARGRRTRFAPSPRPVTCTLAASARLCSTGCLPGSTAASSCCGSTIPTPSETWPKPSSPSSTGFKWLGIDWDEGPEVGGRLTAVLPIAATRPLSGRRRRAARERSRLSRLSPRPKRLQAEREAAEKEKQAFLYSRRWMAETPSSKPTVRSRRPHGVVRLEDAPRGQTRHQRPDSRQVSSSIGPASRTTSSSGPTARACITWPASSTITTSRSRTSSAPRSTSRTRRGRSSSPSRSATRCPSTPTCPTSPSRAARTSSASASSTSISRTATSNADTSTAVDRRGASARRSRPRRSIR